MVVTEGSQENRFKGEKEILVKYETLNNIAEKLYYKDGKINPDTHQELRKIHHIREDISFYTSKLLEKCHPEQIVGVLMQETLNEDIHRVFGYTNDHYSHRNPPSNDDDSLSELAVNNLKMFLKKDYEALAKLHSWGKINPDALGNI